MICPPERRIRAPCRLKTPPNGNVTYLQCGHRRIMLSAPTAPDYNASVTESISITW